MEELREAGTRSQPWNNSVDHLELREASGGGHGSHGGTRGGERRSSWRSSRRQGRGRSGDEEELEEMTMKELERQPPSDASQASHDLGNRCRRLLEASTPHRVGPM
jgi:hypothetical protein